MANQTTTDLHASDPVSGETPALRSPAIGRTDALIDEYIATLPPERRESARRSLQDPVVRRLAERLAGLDRERLEVVRRHL